MTNSTDIYACRVCGEMQDEPPWGLDGRFGNHVHCKVCGNQPGYRDGNKTAIRNHLIRWKNGKARVAKQPYNPEKYDSMIEQLEREIAAEEAQKDK